MRRRRKPYTSPDGIDWRDPQMPLVRRYTLGNGQRVDQVDAEFETAWRQLCMEINHAPEWRDDSTYHSKKGRKNV